MTAVANHGTAYKKFRDIFEKADAEVKSIGDGGELTDDDQRRVQSVADAAISKMAATPFGLGLIRDSELTQVLEELKYGLARHSGELDPESTGYQWNSETPHALRALRFWGGMGKIFHYFRDRGLSLTTESEGVLRQSLIEANDEFVARLDELLGHISVELAYDKTVMRQMMATRKALQDLAAGLKGSKAPLDLPSTMANPFQAGQTIVVRQFVKAVCELCFELFGCIRAKHLDLMLERKSITADELGLTPWLSVESGQRVHRESRRRELDRYIANALKTALKRSSRDEWVTAGALNVFASTTAERNGSAHGGATLENAFRTWGRT